MKDSALSKQSKNLLLIEGFSLLLMGCATSGQFSSAHLTNVELAESNYRILTINVR